MFDGLLTHAFAVTERGGCRMNINVKCAIVAAVAGLLSAIIVNIILRV